MRKTTNFGYCNSQQIRRKASGKILPNRVSDLPAYAACMREKQAFLSKSNASLPKRITILRYRNALLRERVSLPFKKNAILRKKLPSCEKVLRCFSIKLRFRRKKLQFCGKVLQHFSAELLFCNADINVREHNKKRHARLACLFRVSIRLEINYSSLP